MNVSEPLSRADLADVGNGGTQNNNTSLTLKRNPMQTMAANCQTKGTSR